MEQLRLELVGPEDARLPAPSQEHSETSREAATLIEPGAATLRGILLRILRLEGPRTDEQLQERTGMNPSTERPRRGELVRLGLVRNTGQVELTHSGRKATVWTAVFVVLLLALAAGASAQERRRDYLVPLTSSMLPRQPFTAYAPYAPRQPRSMRPPVVLVVPVADGYQPRYVRRDYSSEFRQWYRSLLGWPR